MPTINESESVIAPANRLSSALDLLEKTWNQSNGIQPDLAKDYEGIQAWCWIPNLYQCVEQMFKLMIGKNSKDGKYPQGHRLYGLFQLLSDDHQSNLRSCFRHFLLIHGEIDVSTLDEFLKQIDLGKNNEPGYVSWRYFLLEGFPQERSRIPVQSVDAMFEIARMCSEIIQREFVRQEAPRRLEPLQARLGIKLYHAVTGATRRNEPYLSQEEIEHKERTTGESFSQIMVDLEQYLWNVLRDNLRYILMSLQDDQLLTQEQKWDYLQRIANHLPEKDRAWLNRVIKALSEDRHDFIRYFSAAINGSGRIVKAVYTVNPDSKGYHVALKF